MRTSPTITKEMRETGAEVIPPHTAPTQGVDQVPVKVPVRASYVVMPAPAHGDTAMPPAAITSPRRRSRNPIRPTPVYHCRSEMVNNGSHPRPDRTGTVVVACLRMDSYIRLRGLRRACAGFLAHAATVDDETKRPI